MRRGAAGDWEDVDFLRGMIFKLEPDTALVDFEETDALVEFDVVEGAGECVFGIEGTLYFNLTGFFEAFVEALEEGVLDTALGLLVDVLTVAFEELDFGSAAFGVFGLVTFFVVGVAGFLFDLLGGWEEGPASLSSEESLSFPSSLATFAAHRSIDIPNLIRIRLEVIVDYRICLPFQVFVARTTKVSRSAGLY